MSVEHLITKHLDIWTSAIKTKSASGRGSSKKLELVGIKKLRELILELAVRGKLVPQDPNEEPVSKLLERIDAEKAKLLKAGKIKKLSLKPSIQVKENKEALPNGWVRKQFGEVLFNRDGERKPVSAELRQGMQGEYDYYGASGVIDKVNDFLFDKTLLLIGEDGANLINRSTPIAFLAHGKYWVNNHAHVLDGISLSFLKYIALHINAINLEQYITGTAQPKMNQAKMNSIVLSIPPEAEQNRIVAKVDELMALCDQLEAQTENSIQAHQLLVESLLTTLTNAKDADELSGSWQRISQYFDVLFTTQDSIDELKQTILQLAVMGKLVKQDSNDEPAAKLLERIADEKEELIKDKKFKKQKPSPPISETEKLFDLPDGWRMCRLIDIAYVFSGNSFKSEDFRKGGGVKVIKITNAGVNELIETDEYLPERFLKEYASYIVNQGDLIIALTRPYISAGLKISQCSQSYDKSLLNQRVAAIRAFSNSNFLFRYLQSKFVLNIYQERFGSAGLQPNLKMSDVTELLIPVPPKNEQQRIAAKVDELMDVCNLLQSNINRAQVTQLIVTGALVEQCL